jgi:hypothetical protein
MVYYICRKLYNEGHFILTTSVSSWREYIKNARLIMVFICMFNLYSSDCSLIIATIKILRHTNHTSKTSQIPSMCTCLTFHIYLNYESFDNESLFAQH